MIEDPQPPQPSPLRSLFGGLLLALGILIATLSGLCTLAGLVIFGASGSGNSGNALIALMIGVPPLLVGLLLVWLGRKIRQGPTLPSPPA